MAEPGTERRRRMDPFTLLAGIATLLVSGYVLGDGSGWWPDVDFRWVIAGAAVLAGVILLGSSFRRRS